MGRYVENNLYTNELIVEKARRSGWALFGRWMFGIFFCWLLLIPLIVAIKESIVFSHTELVLTNRRVVRKWGVLHTKSFDAPIEEILNVYVETTFWGRIFNTHLIRISTVHGMIVERICDAEAFKSLILSQREHYNEFRYARQADWTAQALNGKNKNK
jgi:uncharacterized membrane protein YdbT with pleckstrin-like domain